MAKLYVAFFTLLTISILFVYNVALTALPYNAIDYSFKSRMNFLSLMPEGWAFFTKNARDANNYVYKNIHGHFELIDQTGSSPKYLFGFNRKGRGKSAELEALIASVPDTAWKKDSTLNFPQIITKALSYDVVDKVTNYEYSGQIIVVSREPIPWAWSKLADRFEMPFKYIILNVKN